jgi:hypothetical protein
MKRWAILTWCVVLPIGLFVFVLIARSTNEHPPTVSVLFHGTSNSPTAGRITGRVGIFSVTNSATDHACTYDYFVDAQVLQTNGWRQINAPSGPPVWAANLGTLKPSEAHTYIVPEPSKNQFWRLTVSVRRKRSVRDFMERFRFLRLPNRPYFGPGGSQGVQDLPEIFDGVPKK